MLLNSASLRSNFFVRHKRTLLAIVFVFVYATSVSYAVPPSTKYQPGETLNPACAPGDTNCSVHILPDQTGQGGKILTTDGTITSWTSAPSFSLASYDTDDLSEGPTNLYSQWAPVAGGISYTNNIGIGTTTPDQKLTVAGGKFQLNDSNGGTLLLEGVGATSNLISSTGYLGVEGGTGSGINFFVNGSGVESMKILPNGSVGIGTISPGERLDVVGAIRSRGPITTFTANSASMDYASGYTRFYSMGADTSTRGGFLFRTTASDGTLSTVPMTIVPAGDVGIGTMNPQTLLHLSKITGATVRFESTGNGLGADTAIGAVEFYGNDASTPGAGLKARIVATTTAALGNDAALDFYTSNTANNVFAMRIAPNGNVGIGTAAPGSPLSVSSSVNDSISFSGSQVAGITSLLTATATGGRSYAMQSTADSSSYGGGKFVIRDVTAGNSARLAIDSAGNIGIGNTTPSSMSSGNNQLVVGSGTGATGMTVYSGNTSAATIAFNDAMSATNHGLLRYDHSDDSFRIFTSSTEKLRITSGGNVGIGTTAPQTVLEVSTVSTAGEVSATTLSNPSTSAINGVALVFDNHPTLNYSSKIVSRRNNDSFGTNLGFFTQDDTATSSLTEKMTITKLGNVGIGTTTPQKKLHVVDTVGSLPALGSQVGIFQRNATTTDTALLGIISGNAAVAGIQLGDAESIQSGYIYYDNANGRLRLGTTASDRITIDSSGYVGVGVVPTTLLHVSGTLATPGLFERTTTGNVSVEFKNTAGSWFVGRATGTGNFAIRGTASLAGNGGLQLSSAGFLGLAIEDMTHSLTLGSTATGIADYRTSDVVTNYERARMAWNGTTYQIVTEAAGTGVVRNIALMGGNVGVGTTAPVAKLQIGTIAGADGGDIYSFNSAGNPRFLFGDASSSGNFGGLRWDSAGDYLSLYTDSVGTSQFTLLETGNVGIGTTAPGALLHVVATGTAITPVAGTVATFQRNNLTSHSSIVSIVSGATGNATLYFGDSASTGMGRLVYDNSDDSLQIYTASAEKFRVTSGGNVGIGTPSPSVKLDVAGQINAYSASFPVLGFTRETSLVSGGFSGLSGIASAMQLVTKTTGNMADGFGGGIVFDLSDDTHPIGSAGVARIYARRDGGDDIGAMQFFAGTGGQDVIMTLRGSGNVGIGTVAPGYLLHTGSSATLTGTTVARFENAGGTCDIVPSIAGGILCTSDEHLKKNIVTLDGQSWTMQENLTTQDDTIMDRIMMLKPVMYNMRSEADGTPLHGGFIAQEVEQLFPDLVQTDSNGRKAMNYAGLMPYTVAAIQDMNITMAALPRFEDQSMAQKVAAFLRDIAEGVANIGRVQTDELCVGSTCVTETQLQLLLHNAGTGTSGGYVPPSEPVDLTSPVDTSTDTTIPPDDQPRDVVDPDAPVEPVTPSAPDEPTEPTEPATPVPPSAPVETPSAPQPVDDAPTPAPGAPVSSEA